MDMEAILIGQVIKIKRNDGRIHDARIVKVNQDHDAVITKWEEGDLIKYKLVPFEELVSLNPPTAEKEVPQRSSLIGEDSQKMPRKLSLGQSVNVKRTDGRLHAAEIVAINQCDGTAYVQWTRNSEMFGKEVFVEDISVPSEE